MQTREEIKAKRAAILAARTEAKEATNRAAAIAAHAAYQQNMGAIVISPAGIAVSHGKLARLGLGRSFIDSLPSEQVHGLSVVRADRLIEACNASSEPQLIGRFELLHVTSLTGLPGEDASVLGLTPQATWEPLRGLGAAYHAAVMGAGGSDGPDGVEVAFSGPGMRWRFVGESARTVADALPLEVFVDWKDRTVLGIRSLKPEGEGCGQYVVVRAEKLGRELAALLAAAAARPGMASLGGAGEFSAALREAARLLRKAVDAITPPPAEAPQGEVAAPAAPEPGGGPEQPAPSAAPAPAAPAATSSRRKPRRPTDSADERQQAIAGSEADDAA